MDNVPFCALKHTHEVGGLTAGQIHRLWQQVFVDRFCYGPAGINNAERHEPPQFTRAQLQFLAGAVETFGMICYDSGFYHGQELLKKK